MTTFFALFCTTDQPASYINGLLQHAEKHTFDAGNIFCLIEEPGQKRVDKPTAPSVSNFKTGFKGWSIDQLGQFCQDKFNWNNPKSQPPYISDNDFVVLDDRTLRDGTVLLATHQCWRERIDPNDPSDEDEAFRNLVGYRTIRTKRNSAPDLASTLPEIDFSQVIDSLKPEDDGVWRDLEWEKER